MALPGQALRVDLGGRDLYDFEARSYSPDIGAFTQLDSVAGSAINPVTLDRYLYAAGNPETLIDPDGHASLGSVTGNCGPDNYLCAPPDAAAKQQVASYRERVAAEQRVNKARLWKLYGESGDDTEHRVTAPDVLAHAGRDQAEESLTAAQVQQDDAKAGAGMMRVCGGRGGCQEVPVNEDPTPLLVAGAVVLGVAACILFCAEAALTVAAVIGTDAIVGGVASGIADVGGTLASNYLKNGSVSLDGLSGQQLVGDVVGGAAIGSFTGGLGGLVQKIAANAAGNAALTVGDTIVQGQTPSTGSVALSAGSGAAAQGADEAADRVAAHFGATAGEKDLTSTIVDSLGGLASNVLEDIFR